MKRYTNAAILNIARVRLSQARVHIFKDFKAVFRELNRPYMFQCDFTGAFLKMDNVTRAVLATRHTDFHFGFGSRADFVRLVLELTGRVVPKLTL